MLAKLGLLLILALPIPAADVTGNYVLYQEASLSTAVQKLTLQQISSGTRDIILDHATVWCSADATFTISKSGTAATATSATPTKLNSWQDAATAIGYTSSDVGSGTTIKKVAFKQNAPEFTIDLAHMRIPKNAGTTGNITLNTDSITATCRIAIYFSESK